MLFPTAVVVPAAASTMLDADAHANAVKSEIERQQQGVDYDSLSTEELERVCAALQGRLEMVKAAQSARGVDGAAAPKKEAPKMVAKAAVKGDWPELPWGGECHADALGFNTHPRP